MQQNWYERVTTLREQAVQEPNTAGVEALHLFEDWLFERASNLGYNERSGMANYVNYLRRRGQLSREDAARAERFVDIRNCISHRSGLLLSPALTEELLDFVTRLFRKDAWTAEQLMTRHPHTLQEEDSLLDARDWMLANSVSRLPVLRAGRVIALLTSRDLLSLQAQQPDSDPTAQHVADAMRADALEKIIFLPPQAPYDEVLAHLQAPGTSAIFVTEGGDPNKALLGIITVTDLLPKL